MVKIYYNLVVNNILTIDRVPLAWRYYVIEMLNSQNQEEVKEDGNVSST